MMASRSSRKENARTRYDAKMPTVSFRVSKEEYERLEALRKEGFVTYRDLVLKGAGMVKKDRAMERKRRAEEDETREKDIEDAKIEALSCVCIGKCPICGKPFRWNLNSSRIIDQLSDAIESRGIMHTRCIGRSSFEMIH